MHSENGGESAPGLGQFMHTDSQRDCVVRGWRTRAAGITRVDSNVKHRASTHPENTIAIDRWEDEGGARALPANNSAALRSMPNHGDVGVPPPPGSDIMCGAITRAPAACRPLTMRRKANS